MTPGMQELQTHIAAGKRLYMLPFGDSRTGVKRSYVVLRAFNEDHIEDVTATLCKLVGQPWNNDKGTFDVRDGYRQDDTYNLGIRLARALGVSPDRIQLFLL